MNAIVATMTEPQSEPGSWSEPVTWTEVRVLVPEGWEELVADSLAGEGLEGGFVFGTTSVAAEPPPQGFGLLRAYLGQEKDTDAERSRIEGLVAGLASLTGDPSLERCEVRFKPLPPEDYATSWRKSWRPFRVHGLCVVPPWRKDLEGDHARPRAGDRVLYLQPGGSFGSGRHATTRTCLKVLQARLRGSEAVLDAGSGSGILSVAAAVLGAGSCLGFDIQAESRAYGEALAADNGQAERCTFRTGGFETLTEQERGFDVVLANIYSDVIQAHAGDLKARLAPDGWFAFSGCPVHHAEATRAAIRAAGLELQEDHRLGRWHTFVGVHA